MVKQFSMNMFQEAKFIDTLTDKDGVTKKCHPIQHKENYKWSLHK